jgi:hypothetical protein
MASSPTAPTELNALIPISKPAELAAAGLPWRTYHSVQWAFRQRNQNGLKDCFRKLGKTVVVDVAKAHELIRARPAP